jgi:polyphosphate kinase
MMTTKKKGQATSSPRQGGRGTSPRGHAIETDPPPKTKRKEYEQQMRLLPAPAGEVVIFDRSWYNRAGVERVMGVCQPEETERFFDQIPGLEKAMVDSGILISNYCSK